MQRKRCWRNKRGIELKRETALDKVQRAKMVYFTIKPLNVFAFRDNAKVLSLKYHWMRHNQPARAGRFYRGLANPLQHPGL